MTTLGEKIRELRQSLNMKQEELAEGICTRSYISLIENNQLSPSRELLTKLSERLGYNLHIIKQSVITKTHYRDILKQIETLLYNQNYPVASDLLKEIPIDIELPPYEQARMAVGAGYYTNLGIIERMLGNLDESIIQLNRAINCYKKNQNKEKEWNSSYELALTLSQTKKWKELIHILKSAIDEIPEKSLITPNVYALLGEAYTACNLLKIAEENLLLAYRWIEEFGINDFDTKPFILKRLIQLYEQLGDQKKIKQYFDQLLDTLL